MEAKPFLIYRRLLQVKQGLIRRLVQLIAIGIVSISMAACGEQRAPENVVDTAQVTADNGQDIAPSEKGLANASNRKAIIAALGKNFQASQSDKYKKQVATIAPFKIKLVTGQTYTYKDLPKNKAVTLVYFSPTCSECEQFTEALLHRIRSLADREFVYVTYEDTSAVRSFYQRFHLEKYPQIIIGTEGYSFIVQKYYKVQHFPFVASYDPAGRLIHILTNNTQPRIMAKNI